MWPPHEAQRFALFFHMQSAAESARRRRALADYVCSHGEVPDRLDELATPSAIAGALKAAWEEGAFDGASAPALDALTRFVSVHGGSRMPAFEFWTKPQYLIAEAVPPLLPNPLAAVPATMAAAPVTVAHFIDLDTDGDDDDDGDEVVAVSVDAVGAAAAYPRSDDSDPEAREFDAAAQKQIAAKADKRRRKADGLASDDDAEEDAEEDSDEEEEAVPAEDEACLAGSAPPDVVFVSSSGGGDSGAVVACPSPDAVAHAVNIADSPAQSRRPARAPSASACASSIDHAAAGSPHRSPRRNRNVPGRARRGPRTAPGTSHGHLSDDDGDDDDDVDHDDDDAVTCALVSDSQSQPQLPQPHQTRSVAHARATSPDDMEPLPAVPGLPGAATKASPPASTGKRRRQASNEASPAAAPPPAVAKVHAVAGAAQLHAATVPLSLDSNSEDVPASAEPAPADASGPAAGTHRKAASPQKPPKRQSSLLSLFKPTGGQVLRSDSGASAASAPSGSKKPRK